MYLILKDVNVISCNALILCHFFKNLSSSQVLTYVAYSRYDRILLGISKFVHNNHLSNKKSCINHKFFKNGMKKSTLRSLESKTMDWFLYNRNLRNERVESSVKLFVNISRMTLLCITFRFSLSLVFWTCIFYPLLLILSLDIALTWIIIIKKETVR